jgi:hypothetical protein
MKIKQVWKKWLSVTLFVALATLTTTGFTSIDRGNMPAKITADHVPCELSWLTEAAAVPPEVLDEICFATGSDVSTSGFNAASASPVAENGSIEFSWLTEASGIPEEVLREINFSDWSRVRPSELDITLAGPAVPVTDDSLARFEQYLFALGLIEELSKGAAVSSSTGFDVNSWEYVFEMEEQAMTEGW